MNAPIRIVVVDDHTLFRKSLCSLLDQDERASVVGEAASLEELEALLPSVVGDVQVVLMDYHLGENHPDGVEATLWLHERHPQLPVLMLTMHDEREVLVQVARAGASGYILKDSEVEELVRAIELTAEGKGYLSPQMMGKAMAEIARASLEPSGEDEASRPGTYGLTPREMDVLRRLVRGMTYSEIAHELLVSVSQVKQLAASILTKLGARDKAHAAAMAVAKRLVPPPD